MSAVTKRDHGHTMFACDICLVPGWPAAVEYLGDAIEARWMCNWHAAVVRRDVDNDITHWRRIGGEE